MRKQVKRVISEWMVSILVAASIILIIKTFLFAPYEVHGSSMYPTFKGKELLIVNRLIYDISEPDYGDIIVFHTAENRDFIKRVIGKPGDRIALKEGKVFRNGKLLKESYTNKKSYQGTLTKKTMQEKVVPEGHLFVLGDNRGNSTDSREIGPIPISEVVGRADVNLLPLNEFKILFE
ncbi:signal peptidase I [Melghirimyces algeriensis]|uniref:Signal peptidase I n=1 Tax=Melghirimyces algeriensis TaxID=910412 RepID=A0A521EDY7_9BACL|nr:signal peptidase I [Melghirimyces algeriensis]SMO81400.1 type I signal peptidase. Serine peptidase. MEROPS family S26A [Melghirimyces algeriensis]